MCCASKDSPKVSTPGAAIAKKGTAPSPSWRFISSGSAVMIMFWRNRGAKVSIVGARKIAETGNLLAGDFLYTGDKADSDKRVPTYVEEAVPNSNFGQPENSFQTSTSNSWSRSKGLRRRSEVLRAAAGGRPTLLLLFSLFLSG